MPCTQRLASRSLTLASLPSLLPAGAMLGCRRLVSSPHLRSYKRHKCLPAWLGRLCFRERVLHGGRRPLRGVRRCAGRHQCDPR